MSEERLRMLNSLLARYYHILKLAPREMVIKAYWDCVEAGIQPDVKPWPKDSGSE